MKIYLINICSLTSKYDDYLPPLTTDTIRVIFNEKINRLEQKIMKESTSLSNIIFAENGEIDLIQLNTLYRIIGWDLHNRRTETETEEMIRVSHYHISACTRNKQLVGFARVCGDPYIAQVLDVITHPNYRRQGIATRCMSGVLAYLQNSNYVSVTLTDGSGLTDFYQRFGFQTIDAETPTRVWRRRTEINC